MPPHLLSLRRSSLSIIWWVILVHLKLWPGELFLVDCRVKYSGEFWRQGISSELVKCHHVCSHALLNVSQFFYLTSIFCYFALLEWYHVMKKRCCFKVLHTFQDSWGNLVNTWMVVDALPWTLLFNQHTMSVELKCLKLTVSICKVNNKEFMGGTHWDKTKIFAFRSKTETDHLTEVHCSSFSIILNYQSL